MSDYQEIIHRIYTDDDENALYYKSITDIRYPGPLRTNREWLDESYLYIILPNATFDEVIVPGLMNMLIKVADGYETVKNATTGQKLLEYAQNIAKHAKACPCICRIRQKNGKTGQR